MNIGYVRGTNWSVQQEALEDYGIDACFSDRRGNASCLTEKKSGYRQGLRYAEAGDCLVVTTLDVLSREYQQLTHYIEELRQLDLELVVLTSPEVRIEEWQEILTWIIQNDRLIHVQVKRVKKDGTLSKKRTFLFFGRDAEERKLFLSVAKQLEDKESFRMIAKREGIPLETVYWINQEVKQLKLGLFVAVSFFLTVLTIKFAEHFSDNIWIQVGICLISTGLILFNTLADSEE